MTKTKDIVMKVILIFLLKLQDTFNNIFKSNADNNNHEGKTYSTATVKRIQRLQNKLVKLEQSYSVNIEGLKQVYNKELFEYDRRYQEFAKSNHRYEIGRITKEEFETAKLKIKPYEDVLKEAEENLSNAEKYRQEEVQNIINELIQLQSVYADDMVNSVKRKSKELQKARHAYLKAISNVGYDYKAVVNTNEIIQRYSEQAGRYYNRQVLHEFEVKSDSLPVLLNDLQVEQETVSRALNGLI